MNNWNIKGHIVEYYDDYHTYLVDGVIVPSITTLLKSKFKHKYDNVPESTLKRAANRGTEIHKEIENYSKYGEVSDNKELKDFIFLQNQYGFEIIDSEVPILLFDNDKVISVGRLDLVLSKDDKLGLADIKTTAVLDKEYLAYQLNLYRIGYQQSYDKKIEFLKGIHLKNGTRKYTPIPINEEKILEFIKEKKL